MITDFARYYGNSFTKMVESNGLRHAPIPPRHHRSLLAEPWNKRFGNFYRVLEKSAPRMFPNYRMEAINYINYMNLHVPVSVGESYVVPHEKHFGKKIKIQELSCFGDTCIVPGLSTSSCVEPKGKRHVCLGPAKDEMLFMAGKFVPVESLGSGSTIVTRALADARNWLPWKEYKRQMTVRPNVEFTNAVPDIPKTPESVEKTFLAAAIETGIFPEKLTNDKVGNNNVKLLALEQIKTGYDLKRAKYSARQKFKEPIIKEILNIIEHNVFKARALSSVPVDAQVIGSMLVLTVKRTGQLKARWVAFGNEMERLEVIETYSPTVSDTTLRVLLLYALQHDLPLQSFDIASAYLNGRTDKPVFMKLPYPLSMPGFILEIFGNLYGLRNAGQTWYKCLSECLYGIGLVHSDIDPCLFIMKDRKLCVCVHVDDGCCAASATDYR